MIVELRQDLIATAEGAARWAGVVADALAPVLDLPDLHIINITQAAPARAGPNRRSGGPDEHRRQDAHGTRGRRLPPSAQPSARPARGAEHRHDEPRRFCRNCLSNWLKDASDERGLGLGKEDLRTYVYGMPYDEWKAKNQTEASPEQMAKFASRRPRKASTAEAGPRFFFASPE